MLRYLNSSVLRSAQCKPPPPGRTAAVVTAAPRGKAALPVGSMLQAKLKKRIRQLFEEGDLDTLTERKIRETLVKEFGDVANQQSEAIGDEIETLLQEMVGDEDDGDVEEEDDEPPAKKAKENKAPAGKGSVDKGVYTLHLGSKKRLTVKLLKNSLLIDLREWYEDKSTGEEKPGKGIALHLEEWLKLSSELKHLQKALQDQDTDFSVQLTDTRKASVSDFKGKGSVQVREFYQDAEGEWKPGKKGLAMDEAALNTLAANASAITAHAHKLEPKAAASKQSKASAAAASQTPAAAAVAERGAAGSSGGGGGAQALDLGQNKRVTVSTFSGAPLVDLREWYHKGSELAPGKKGISLKPGDWRTLVGALPDITAALDSRDMSYSLQLTNKRKVNLSEFKGKYYVAVREYYEKGGQELPGAKGLNMSEDQWRKLAAGAEAFTAAAVPP